LEVHGCTLITNVSMEAIQYPNGHVFWDYE